TRQWPCGSALGGPPAAVEAAGRVALEVQRHELVAGPLQALYDRVAVGEERLHLLRLDLDPGDVAVVADPDLGEAERLHGRLRPLDAAQGLDRHRRPVRNSR